MPRIILKVDAETDRYIYWSSITESPICVGTRDELLVTLTEIDHMRSEEVEPRLKRADKNGTSDMSILDGGWDDYGMAYQQRGTLLRNSFGQAWDLLSQDIDADLGPIVEQWPDDDE